MAWSVAGVDADPGPKAERAHSRVGLLQSGREYRRRWLDGAACAACTARYGLNPVRRIIVLVLILLVLAALAISDCWAPGFNYCKRLVASVAFASR